MIRKMSEIQADIKRNEQEHLQLLVEYEEAHKMDLSDFGAVKIFGEHNVRLE